MKMGRWLWMAAGSLILSACGGGGGGSGCSVFDSNCGGDPDPGGSAQVAELVVILDRNTLPNTSTDSVTATITAVGAGGVVVADAPVALSVDTGALLIASAPSTDSSGRVTGQISLGADRSNRIVTLTATSGSISRTASFQVVGANLSASPNPPIIAPGSSGTVEFRLTDASGSGMVGQSISVSGNGIATVTGVTGTDGKYNFSYVAPNILGELRLTAQAAGASVVQPIQVQSTTIDPAVGPINSASVTANPSVVGANTGGSTSSRTEIRALFLGASNAPIPRVRVRFDLNGDANSIGGSFSTTDLVYSNTNGEATAAYIPADRASPTNGVTIRACYDLNDFPAGTCPNQALTTVTVTDQPVSVAIGFNDQIRQSANQLSYIKDFVVSVADSSGRAKPDVVITPSVDLTDFFTGFLTWDGSAWVVGGPVYQCPNEDINRNNVLEAGENYFQRSGQPVVLEPPKSAVTISTTPSNGRTGPDGTMVVSVQYPKNYGYWVQMELTVAASGISGTEARASILRILDVDATAISRETPPPAFVESPFGTLPQYAAGATVSCSLVP